MMKKLLVLVMVLCMALPASAALQISVNGEQNPVDSQISLNVGQSATLDIWADTDIPAFGGYVWVLTVSTATGEISGGVAIDFGVDVASSIAGDTLSNPTVMTPVGEEGYWGSITNFSFTVPIAAGTVLYDLFNMECLAEGDAIVSLYESPGQNVQITEADLMDRVTIHQVPEPATMLLLGIGGLFLHRRKK